MPHFGHLVFNLVSGDHFGLHPHFMIHPTFAPMSYLILDESERHDCCR